MTPTLCCGFECGQIGTVGQHFKSVGTTAPTISTTTVNNGARSLRVNLAAASGYAKSNATIGTIGVVRFYFRVISAPTTDAFIGGITDTFDTDFAGIGYKLSDGKYYTYFNGLASTGGVTLASGWHYADVRANFSSGTSWTADASIDGIALTTMTLGTAATDSATGAVFGSVVAVTYDIYYDDVIISATSADYPIGAGKVLAFVPASDGTHTATTTVTVKGTAATPVGAAITSATTDSFNWINARPIGGGATDATRLINAQTAASTLYTEHGIEQTTEANAPRAVEVLVIDQQATTAVGDMHIKVNDNGAETVVLDRTAVAGVVTDRYTTKQFATMPNGGAAWTLTRFNALKLRFGYSADATPDQYFRGAMVEAEFQATATVVKQFGLLGVG